MGHAYAGEVSEVRYNRYGGGPSVTIQSSSDGGRDWLFWLDDDDDKYRPGDAVRVVLERADESADHE